MKALFDANIVLDILLKRPGYSDCAMAVAKSQEPWLSTLSLANICYFDAQALQLSCPFRRGKLAALVGIEDFRAPPAFLDCDRKRLARQGGVHRIGYRPTQHIARVPVHHRTR